MTRRGIPAAIGVAAAVALFAPGARADVSNFVLLGGMNLSSPRTALDAGLTSYLGMALGFGFDIHIVHAVYVEADALYINRRYTDSFTLSTATVPLLIKFEDGPIMMGVGPYVATIMAASSDVGGSVTPSALGLTTTDLGVVAQFGLRMPLSRSVNLIADGRVWRAVTSTYGGISPFYWANLTGFAGVQIALKRGRGGTGPTRY